MAFDLDRKRNCIKTAVEEKLQYDDKIWFTFMHFFSVQKSSSIIPILALSIIETPWTSMLLWPLGNSLRMKIAWRSIDFFKVLVFLLLQVKFNWMQSHANNCSSFNPPITIFHCRSVILSFLHSSFSHLPLLTYTNLPLPIFTCCKSLAERLIFIKRFPSIDSYLSTYSLYPFLL